MQATPRWAMLITQPIAIMGQRSWNWYPAKVVSTPSVIVFPMIALPATRRVTSMPASARTRIAAHEPERHRASRRLRPRYSWHSAR